MKQLNMWLQDQPIDYIICLHLNNLQLSINRLTVYQVNRVMHNLMLTYGPKAVNKNLKIFKKLNLTLKLNKKGA